MLGPKNTAADVAALLQQGLKDGSITLDTAEPVKINPTSTTATEADLHARELFKKVSAFSAPVAISLTTTAPQTFAIPDIEKLQAAWDSLRQSAGLPDNEVLADLACKIKAFQEPKNANTGR